jgi:hypothetical protein
MSLLAHMIATGLFCHTGIKEGAPARIDVEIRIWYFPTEAEGPQILCL